MTKRKPLARASKSTTIGRVAPRGTSANALALIGELRELIEAARQRIATAANASHTQLCWHVGRRILAENLHSGLAAYGKRILVTVSQQLTAEFGHSFDDTASAKHDRRSVAEACP